MTNPNIRPLLPADRARYCAVRAEATRLDELLAQALWIAGTGKKVDESQPIPPLYLIQAYTIRRLPEMRALLGEILDVKV